LLLNNETFGANLETKLEGLTPLQLAVIQGHSDVVRFILGKGADANAVSEGYSSIHFAAEYDRKEILQVLKL
jgi:ankyrin repeat protein